MGGQWKTYKGGCDFIRVVDGLRQWDHFHPGELIEGKRYLILGNAFAAPGKSLLKEDSRLNVEDSWKYYSFYSVKNETGQEIFIYEEFFEE